MFAPKIVRDGKLHEFISLFTLFFGIFGIVNGIFLTWAGSGRAGHTFPVGAVSPLVRMVGVVLLISAIVSMIFFVDGTFGAFGVIEGWGSATVTKGISSWLGAFTGFLIPATLLIIMPWLSILGVGRRKRRKMKS